MWFLRSNTDRHVLEHRYEITDTGSAENNFEGSVTQVSDMCAYTSGSYKWQGVTLFGTSSGLLVNSGSGSGEHFIDERIEVPGSTFTSTNTLTFGFSQCGQTVEDVKLHDAILTFDGMNPSSFDISDIQITGGGEITSISYVVFERGIDRCNTLSLGYAKKTDTREYINRTILLFLGYAIDRYVQSNHFILLS